MISYCRVAAKADSGRGKVEDCFARPLFCLHAVNFLEQFRLQWPTNHTASNSFNIRSNKTASLFKGHFETFYRRGIQLTPTLNLCLCVTNGFLSKSGVVPLITEEAFENAFSPYVILQDGNHRVRPTEHIPQPSLQA